MVMIAPGVTRTVPTALQPRFGGPTFSLRNRLARATWMASWLLLASWTPSPFTPWRRVLLRFFGARIHKTAMIRSSASIWWPKNLEMGAHASLGPGVICYNVGQITIGDGAIVSQRAHLCTGTHDIDDPDFPLQTYPIVIGRHAWIAAEAFVGPGVTIGEGAVLGARAVAAKSLAAWTIYVGNPARALRTRTPVA
jgi:putative colanic acid biosynthesis acetyltransferase WcaF